MALIDYDDALEAGWRIFPIHPMTFKNGIGECTCGNPNCDPKSAGKHPRNTAWQHTPVWDDVQLATLIDEDGLFDGNQFEGHYGIVVNTSGLVVVDVDGRNGGWESAKKLAHIREQCAFIVATGSGDGEHWYFKKPEGSPDLRYKHDEYPGIEFKSTGYVVGCGSMHRIGNTYHAISGSPAQVCDAPDELIQLLKRPERSLSTSGEEVNLDELPGLVDAIPNTQRDYDKWISIGMALHDATDGSQDGLSLWVKWSAKNSEAHDDSQMDYKWHSFGRGANKVTVGTLYALAFEAGYTKPVTFEDCTDWEPMEEEPQATPSVSSVMEIPKPHGLVGELTDWINSRSIYPRENLAVAAALHIVSNAAALRYRVAPLKTTLNLLTLGTAASRTGKGVILECVKEAHERMGLNAVLMGDFKSTKDLILNAIENQPIYYALDEMGGFFSKTSNSSKNGASYLEDLLEKIMQMFTEGNSYHLLTGSLKREMADAVDKDLARLNKLLDDAKIKEDDPRLIQALEKRKWAKTGIPKPCLSMFALGEPSKFDAAILKDPWLLVGGFLGRALIFDEPETVPMKKPDDQINTGSMPDGLAMRLSSLFWGGNFPAEGARIQLDGDPVMLQLSPDAATVKNQVETYWREVALRERDEGSQLESQALGAPELALKVAGVLGAEAGIITKQDMEWAQALVRKVTLEKIYRAKSGEKMTNGDSKERGDGLQIGILTAVRAAGTQGLTVGRIRNKVSRKTPTEIVQKAIDHLVERGKLFAETKTGANGKTTVLYFSKG